MKKLLSFVAALSLAASASAAVDLSYTVDPAAGEVTELETIALTFPNCVEMDFISKSNITLNHDGTALDIKSSYNANVITIKLSEKATAPGEYVLDFPADTFSGYSSGYADSSDNTAFSIVYNIAGGEEVDKFAYTVSPEQGEVESLDKITLTFTYTGWTNIKIVDKSAITMTLDGSPISCKASEPISGKKDRIIVTNTMDDKSVAGEYVITIPAGSFRADVKGYETADSEKNPKDIVLRYTIKGSETPDPGTDPGTGGDLTGPWGYQATPAPGVVKELSEIKVVFPNWEEVDVNSSDDIVLSYNDSPVAARVTANGTGFTIKLSEPATAAGTYKLSVAAWALTGYKDLTDEGYQKIEDCTAISFEYIIEGETPAEIDFTVKADPADMLAVKTLDKVVITFTGLDAVTVGEDWPAVLVDNSPLTVADYSTAVEANVVTVNITKALEGPADVQIVFPAETVTGRKGDDSAVNSEDIIINYALLGGVEYDLSLALSTPTNPNSDGEISAEKQISTFFFSSDVKGLVAAEGTEANVTIKQVNGDFERTAHLNKGFGLNQNYTYFMADFGSEPTYNGEYEITIARGAFGDEVWASDPETGHSNPELVLKFTLVDGRDIDLNTVQATVSPEAGTYDSFSTIATVTISFDEEMTPVEGAGATLVAEDGSLNYNVSAEFIKADNGYTVTFPTPEGSLSSTERFIFSVLAGQFKNAAGLGNAEINLVYTVDKNNGVTGIEVIENGKAEIFTLSGVRMTGKALTPGIYIVNGVKVYVK